MSSRDTTRAIVGRIQFTRNVAPLGDDTAFENFRYSGSDEGMVLTRFRVDPLQNGLGIAPIENLKGDRSKFLDN